MATTLIERLMQSHPALTRRVQNGSFAAAIRLYCLSCMGGAPSEVEMCTIKNCPLFCFRNGKYTGKKLKKEAIDEEK